MAPWLLFDILFTHALFNPNFATIYNNLFSPLLPLEYNIAWPTTPNPERSRLFLQFLIGLQLMTLNLIYTGSPRQQIRHCLAAIFLSGAALAVIGGLMKLTGSREFLWLIELREPAAYATFFYKNHWAYFALLAAGCGMALFHNTYAKEKHSGHLPEKSIGIALLILVILISIPLAEARGASLVAIPLMIAFILSITRPLHKHGTKLALSITLCLLILTGLGLYQVAKPQIIRAQQRSHSQIEAAKHGNFHDVKRLALYRDCWSMFRDRPYWGWGIGSFIHIHPIYAGPEFYEINAAYPIAYEFTHNDYLQALAEMGLVGSLLLLSPFVCLLIGSHKKAKWLNKISPWLLSATCAVMIAASFDMALAAPAIAMGTLLIGASSVSYALQAKQHK
ncbi:O-antigen ligase family protein [Coraliomargarita sp. SDUM461003]|uniref:O-antigen ligase family protein n=1 Tax=Thalassobacterium maritimum TaxID=3041265 RepID=A0ABU1AYM9_9BACT|nr:O-antigen ligase family protein [Coraliomargarita sp. SDUM461003]MDQ8208220.1 O-antigen ligase family protein [Coraliomargarita sp. SDUM461003]